MAWRFGFEMVWGRFWWERGFGLAGELRWERCAYG